MILLQCCYEFCRCTFSTNLVCFGHFSNVYVDTIKRPKHTKLVAPAMTFRIYRISPACLQTQLSGREGRQFQNTKAMEFIS